MKETFEISNFPKGYFNLKKIKITMIIFLMSFLRINMKISCIKSYFYYTEKSSFKKINFNLEVSFKFTKINKNPSFLDVEPLL